MAQVTPLKISGDVDLHHYLFPVDMLKTSMEMIIQQLIVSGKEGKNIVRKGDYLSKMAMENEHYVNISIMLATMHKCSRPMTLSTIPTTHLNFCSKTPCSNTTISYCKLDQESPTLCRKCNLNISNNTIGFTVVIHL